MAENIVICDRLLEFLNLKIKKNYYYPFKIDIGNNSC